MGTLIADLSSLSQPGKPGIRNTDKPQSFADCHDSGTELSLEYEQHTVHRQISITHVLVNVDLERDLQSADDQGPTFLHKRGSLH